MWSGENKEKMKRKIKTKKKKRYNLVPKLGCMRSNDDDPTVHESDDDGSFEMESARASIDGETTHLIVMVNGIIGSAQNWRFAAKQFLNKYPKDVIVHCSESNSSTLTFDGVDVMGKRLADEVVSVIKGHPNLKKISFIGHSLGGLVARYAIAKLYGLDLTGAACQEDGESRKGEPKDPSPGQKLNAKIAGLVPVNFITVATPHLGSRGHKQVPMFCGFYTLEKAASHMSWFLGRTGKHLFLTDRDDRKPPLLLQMVNDSEDLKFMSALQSFQRRVAYANSRFDHIVGWSTSSLRHRTELPKRKHLHRNDKYPHIVNMETAKIPSSRQEVSSEAEIKGKKTDDMEAVMIRNLTKLSWERIDVNFRGSKQRFLAHSTIQVKNMCKNSDGADVVQHMVDNFLL